MAGILPFGVVFIELFFVLTVSYEWFYLGSITPELQNRVTHYDVTNRVINSKIFFFLIFRVSDLM